MSETALPPIALSTMYFQRWPGATDLAPFFAAGHAMGFEAFELSHILLPETVAGLTDGAERIPVVHHPCPRPPAFSEADGLTAPMAMARTRAATALVDSIATANRLGASVVVVHLGRLSDDASGSLARLRFEVDSRCQAGQVGTSAFAAARDALADRIAAEEPAHLERALETLAGPLSGAKQLGVRIGLETGYHPDELPTPAGMRRLLAELDPTVVGAWLDTGHMGAQAARGLATFDEWFAATEGRVFGAHYHDIVGLRDHLPPGQGALDFQQIARHLPPGLPATLEVDWYFEPDEVRAGAAHLQLALLAAAVSQAN